MQALPYNRLSRQGQHAPPPPLRGRPLGNYSSSIQQQLSISNSSQIQNVVPQTIQGRPPSYRQSVCHPAAATIQIHSNNSGQLSHFASQTQISRHCSSYQPSPNVMQQQQPINIQRLQEGAVSGSLTQRFNSPNQQRNVQQRNSKSPLYQRQILLNNSSTSVIQQPIIRHFSYGNNHQNADLQKQPLIIKPQTKLITNTHSTASSLDRSPLQAQQQQLINNKTNLSNKQIPQSQQALSQQQQVQVQQKQNNQQQQQQWQQSQQANKQQQSLKQQLPIKINSDKKNLQLVNKNQTSTEFKATEPSAVPIVTQQDNINSPNFKQFICKTESNQPQNSPHSEKTESDDTQKLCQKIEQFLQKYKVNKANNEQQINDQQLLDRQTRQDTQLSNNEQTFKEKEKDTIENNINQVDPNQQKQNEQLQTGQTIQQILKTIDKQDGDDNQEQIKQTKPIIDKQAIQQDHHSKCDADKQQQNIVDQLLLKINSILFNNQSDLQSQLIIKQSQENEPIDKQQLLFLNQESCSEKSFCKPQTEIINLDELPCEKTQEYIQLQKIQDQRVSQTSQLFDQCKFEQRQSEFKKTNVYSFNQEDEVPNVQKIIKQQQQNQDSFPLQIPLPNNNKLQKEAKKKSLLINTEVEKKQCKASEAQIIDPKLNIPKLQNLNESAIFTQFKNGNGESMKFKKRNFQIGKSLGNGKFGDVFIARDLSNNLLVALKAIKKSIVKKYKAQQMILNEVKIQSMLNHPNIVKTYGFFQDSKCIYIVQELLPEGDLYNDLKSQPNKRYNETQASDYVKQILEAILHLQQFNIIHRDIKPENILFSFGLVKLGDFGCAVQKQDNNRTTFCGTLDYISPEMVEGSDYGQEIDMWSLGILAYEMLSGVPPFSQNSKQDTFNNILNVNLIYPQFISEEAKHFISRLLIKNPKERMSVKEALEHQWIVQNEQKRVLSQSQHIDQFFKNNLFKDY